MVAIVTWNNSEDAIRCARSLLAQVDTGKFPILFIDNASKPEAIQQLKQFMASDPSGRMKLTQTGENSGTAGGFTTAAKWAKEFGYDYFGCLNADAVADVGWVKGLMKEIKRVPDCGIVAGAILSQDGQEVDTTGELYTTWGLPAPRGRGQPAKSRPSAPGYIFGATGGGFLARTAMYDHIGYYDRAMFMYYEDIDLSFRAQLAGYKVRYTPDAIAHHKRGASSSGVPGLATYNTFKNLPMVFVKNVPLRLWLSMYPRFVLVYTLILGNAIFRGRGWPALKGYAASWRYLKHMLAERRRIQKSRVVDVGYVSSIILREIPPDQSGLRKLRAVFTRKSK